LSERATAPIASSTPATIASYVLRASRVCSEHRSSLFVLEDGTYQSGAHACSALPRAFAARREQRAVWRREGRHQKERRGAGRCVVRRDAPERLVSVKRQVRPVVRSRLAHDVRDQPGHQGLDRGDAQLMVEGDKWEL